jgi:hypothetical protein
MEIFFDRILQLMPVLGTDVLLPIGAAPEGLNERRSLLTCEIKGIKAYGHPTPSGFVVKQGSQAVLKERVPTARR